MLHLFLLAGWHHNNHTDTAGIEEEEEYNNIKPQPQLTKSNE
jgi:hypothetical protein